MVDHRGILSRGVLRLSADIREGPEEAEALIIKNDPAKTYMTVSSNQWAILQRFKGGNSASKILPELIQNRRCPALKEFYELILKGRKEKMLEPTWEEPESAFTRAMNWRWKVTFNGAVGIGFFCFFFGIAGLSYNYAVDLPKGINQIVVGYLLVILALSFGQVMAACVLRGYECEVYRPYLDWKTLLPHFRFDLDDAVMGGRFCRIAVGLLRMAPLFLLTGICAFSFPDFEFLLMIAILWAVSPFGDTPSTQIIRALFDEMHLSTDRDYLFEENRRFRERLHRPLRFTNGVYNLIFTFYSLSWLASIFTWAVFSFELETVALVGEIVQFALRRDVLTTEIVILSLVVLGFASYFCLNDFIRSFKRMQERRRKFATAPIKARRDLEIPKEEIEKLLSDSLLFGELTPPVISEIADRVERVLVKRGQYLLREGEADADRLFIVFSGRVEVLRELKTGRMEKVSALGRADVFGEVALIHHVPRNRSVRATKPSILLTIDEDTFRAAVLEYMDFKKVEEIVQKRAFLHRIPLCWEWERNAIKRLAELSFVTGYRPGYKVVDEGTFNQFFYIVYEGVFNVERKGKRVARLNGGDFFGEISILENSVSVADVVADRKCRCVGIHCNDFLRFLAEDYRVALYFERISSKRLKHPIFPLKN